MEPETLMRHLELALRSSLFLITISNFKLSLWNVLTVIFLFFFSLAICVGVA